MNPKKLERIIRLLRENQVSHLKTLEFEITLSGSGVPFVASSVTQEKKSEGPAVPTPNEIPHHVNEVANLLKLSDEELVDKLFPEPKAEAGEI